jgi:hypothetical protein
VTSFSAITERRLRLLALGIAVLPATVSKEVFLTEWSTRHVDEAEVRSWPPSLGPNDGARTEFHPCLDLDIRDEAAVEACEQLVRDKFDGQGELLVRTGRAPKGGHCSSPVPRGRSVKARTRLAMSCCGLRWPRQTRVEGGEND